MNINLLTAFVIICMIISSCHVSMPHDDIMIINKTPDTLYYAIGGYKFRDKNIRNMAYERVTDEMTNRTFDSIPGYTFNPNDAARPGKLDTTWKKFAEEKGGVTVLFYKKDIEKLPPNRPLTTDEIYKRIDLTKKQLDSLGYKIVLR